MITHDKSWINTREASKLAGVLPCTIGAWCDAYGIGRKVAGRYRIDPAALEALLTGGAAPVEPKP